MSDFSGTPSSASASANFCAPLGRIDAAPKLRYSSFDVPARASPSAIAAPPTGPKAFDEMSSHLRLTLCAIASAIDSHVAPLIAFARMLSHSRPLCAATASAIGAMPSRRLLTSSRSPRSDGQPLRMSAHEPAASLPNWLPDMSSTSSCGFWVNSPAHVAMSSGFRNSLVASQSTMRSVRRSEAGRPTLVLIRSSGERPAGMMLSDASRRTAVRTAARDDPAIEQTIFARRVHLERVSRACPRSRRGDDARRRSCVAQI